MNWMSAQYLEAEKALEWAAAQTETIALEMVGVEDTEYPRTDLVEFNSQLYTVLVCLT